DYDYFNDPYAGNHLFFAGEIVLSVHGDVTDSLVDETALIDFKKNRKINPKKRKQFMEKVQRTERFVRERLPAMLYIAMRTLIKNTLLESQGTPIRADQFNELTLYFNKAVREWSSSRKRGWQPQERSDNWEGKLDDYKRQVENRYNLAVLTQKTYKAN